MPTSLHIIVAVIAGVAAGAAYYGLGLLRLRQRAIASRAEPVPPLPPAQPADPETVARFVRELNKSRESTGTSAPAP